MLRSLLFSEAVRNFQDRSPYEVRGIAVRFVLSVLPIIVKASDHTGRNIAPALRAHS